MQIIFIVVAALLPSSWGWTFGHPPTYKCKDPLPTYPGFDISKIEGSVFSYIYTPKNKAYKLADSVAMLIKRNESAGENVYTQSFHAYTVFYTKKTFQFNLKYLGDGVFEKDADEDGSAFKVSIVALGGPQNHVGLLYVCNDESDVVDEDVRYVISPKDVDPDDIYDPNAMFRDVNEKYGFQGEFRRMPHKKPKKDPSSFWDLS